MNDVSTAITQWEDEHKDTLRCFLIPDERHQVVDMVMSAPFQVAPELFRRGVYSRGLNLAFENVRLMEPFIAWPDEWTDRMGGVWILDPELRVLCQSSNDTPPKAEDYQDDSLSLYTMAVGMLDAWRSLAIAI